MQLNSLMNDGQVQAYFSDAANAEVTYSDQRRAAPTFRPAASAST